MLKVGISFVFPIYIYNFATLKKKLIMNTNRVTPELISSLKENEIFVFGSNVQGDHVGGAARYALINFGAIMGQGEGLQGKSYAIPSCVRIEVKDCRYTKPFDSAAEMTEYVKRFIEFAKEHVELHFYVTKIGCGIAGMSIADVAKVFEGCAALDNVSLPIEFWSYYQV